MTKVSSIEIKLCFSIASPKKVKVRLKKKFFVSFSSKVFVERWQHIKFVQGFSLKEDFGTLAYILSDLYLLELSRISTPLTIKFLLHFLLAISAASNFYRLWDKRCQFLHGGHSFLVCIGQFLFPFLHHILFHHINFNI